MFNLKNAKFVVQNKNKMILNSVKDVFIQFVMIVFKKVMFVHFVDIKIEINN